MAKFQLPMDYLIHFHFWSGDLGQYDTWIKQYFRTLFSLNSGLLKRLLTQGQLQFLESVHLDKVAFESHAPYHGSEGSSQNMGTPAGFVWATKKFKELGNRAEDERIIAQKAKENVIRFYRPDLSIVTMPVTVTRTLGAAILSRDAATASATTSAPVITHNTYTYVWADRCLR